MVGASTAESDRPLFERAFLEQMSYSYIHGVWYAFKGSYLLPTLKPRTREQILHTYTYEYVPHPHWRAINEIKCTNVLRFAPKWERIVKYYIYMNMCPIEGPLMKSNVQMYLGLRQNGRALLKLWLMSNRVRVWVYLNRELEGEALNHLWR